MNLNLPTQVIMEEQSGVSDSVEGLREGSTPKDDGDR